MNPIPVVLLGTKRTNARTHVGTIISHRIIPTLQIFQLSKISARQPYLNTCAQPQRRKETAQSCVAAENTKELSYVLTRVTKKVKCQGYQGPYIYLCHLIWASYPIVFILFLISQAQINLIHLIVGLLYNLRVVIKLVSKLWGVTLKVC